MDANVTTTELAVDPVFNLWNLTRYEDLKSAATTLLQRVTDAAKPHFVELTSLQLKIGAGVAALALFAAYKYFTHKPPCLSLGEPEHNIDIILSRPSRVQQLLVDDARELYVRNQQLENSLFRRVRKNICKAVAGAVCGLIPIVVIGGSLMGAVYVMNHRDAIAALASRVYLLFPSTGLSVAGLSATAMAAGALGYKFLTSEAGQTAIGVVVGHSFLDSVKMGSSWAEEWYDDAGRLKTYEEHKGQISTYMKQAFDEMAQHLIEQVNACEDAESLTDLKARALKLKDALNHHCDHVFESSLHIDLGKINDMTLDLMSAIGKVNSYHLKNKPKN